MVRALLWGVIHLLSNTVGLLVAWAVLSGVHLDASGFVVAVLIFTVVETLAEPLLRQMAFNSARALQGSVALLTTFVGLILTDVLTKGLSISGVSTWIFATLIVWITTLLAELVLPLFVLRRALDEHGGHRRR